MPVWLKWFLYRWLSPESCVLSLLIIALSQGTMINMIKLNALYDIRPEQLASLVYV